MLCRGVLVQGPGGVANLHVQTQLDEATGATHMLMQLLDKSALLLLLLLNMIQLCLQVFADHLHE